MQDFLRVGVERVCIQCVANSRLPLAEPALAGAAAVLRTLQRESELEWRAQLCRPFVDERRAAAIRETAEVVLWWITPPNLRTPEAALLSERMTMEVIAKFDRLWVLRSTAARSLSGIYSVWKQRQMQMLRYADLEAVDRQYASLIASESTSH